MNEILSANAFINVLLEFFNIYLEFAGGALSYVLETVDQM